MHAKRRADSHIAGIWRCRRSVWSQPIRASRRSSISGWMLPLSRMRETGLPLKSSKMPEDARPDVALFVPSLGGGGAEKMVVHIANALVERGYRVDLVLCHDHGELTRLVDGRVRRVDLRSPRVSRSLGALSNYLCRARPPALLSVLDRANIIAVLAKLLTRSSTRIVISQRSNYSRSAENNGSGRSRALAALVRLLYPFADALVGISDGVADDIRKSVRIAPEKVVTIYNPVLPADFRAPPARMGLHEFFDRRDGPVIIAVGRLSAAKDYETLLKAFAKVRQATDARLIILGEGELRQSLIELAGQLGLSPFVAMPGFVPDPTSWMVQADVFVLSSAWEGFGNVVVEALACGLPVVSTDCESGPGEILEQGKWGRLVPVGNADIMAEALVASLRAARPAEASPRANDFTIDSSVDSYARILQLAPSESLSESRMEHSV
jgi:glycosyltransferase involved in cell wall biosynthesis